MTILLITLGIIIYSFLVWWVCDGFNEEYTWVDYITMICIFPAILCIGLVGIIIYLIDIIINKIYGTIHGR
jgi:hypothetical protein